MLMNLMTKMKSFAKDEKGATAIEYAVIAAIIIVVGLAVFGTIGTSMDTKFSFINTTLSTTGS